MSALDHIVNRLTFLLRLHAKGGARVRKMTYTSLPLVTNLQFEGTPLRSIMSPPVPDDGLLTEQIFDSWLWPMHAEEGDSVKDLVTAGGEALYKFIARGDTVQDMTVRLLYALGNAPGATLKYDENWVWVTHGDRTYGIDASGTVHSRFCSGLYLGHVYPKKCLEGVRQVTVQDHHFCGLYREAYRRGAANALIALHMGQPGFSFRKMAESAAPKSFPTTAKLRQWEAILGGARDPVARLYRALVPQWMTSGEFGRVICALSSRPLAPKPDFVQGCITRLHHHFYKNKKDNKK